MPEAKTISKKVVDGFVNLLTGFGIQGRDKTKSTSIQMESFMIEYEQISFYEFDGFGKKIVDLPVREMTRKGFTVEGDTDGAAVDYYKKKRFGKAVRELLRWSKVYGGALAVLIVDDGGQLEDPLNMDSIKSVDQIKVYHRWRVDCTQGYDRNPQSETYGQLLYYTVNPTNMVGQASFRVHVSRTISIDGIDLPADERARNNGWGLSVYQSSKEQIKRVSVIHGIVENIMEEFETGILSIENLQEMIANGQEDVIKKRLELLDLSKHVINMRLLDAREKFDKKSSTVTGIKDIMDEYSMALSSVTGIPVSLLMGRSPAGLNATGESDVRFWYDQVSSEQEDVLEPVDSYIVKLIMHSKDSKFKGKEPENWSIKYLPLWQMTEKENAEIKKIMADTDRSYIETGVLDPAEVAQSRFGGEKYSIETELSADRE